MSYELKSIDVKRQFFICERLLQWYLVRSARCSYYKLLQPKEFFTDDRYRLELMPLSRILKKKPP